MALVFVGLNFSTLITQPVEIFSAFFVRQIAIELIEEGSKSVGQNFGSIFFPIVPFVFHVVVVAFFAGVAMFLSSW